MIAKVNSKCESLFSSNDLAEGVITEHAAFVRNAYALLTALGKNRGVLKANENIHKC